MKKFKSSDLTHKRREVMSAAEDSPVLIQERRTNSEVINELVLMAKGEYDEIKK